MVKARKQITKPIGPQKSDKKSKQDYNIWYHKHSGERHKPGEERVKASTRCNSDTDAGESRGTHNDIAGICLNFARGCCLLGYDCSWLHVVPESGNFKEETMKDCFGRERHEDVRDDQSGVGSFAADDETSRTLYVGGIVRSPDMHSVVYKHFNEWGAIENVRVLDSKGVAFVRYKWRSNAEFAMEAMQRQSLDNNEVLNVRWANKDPNPWAEKRKQINAKRKVADAAINAGILTHDVTDPPASKRHNPSVDDVTGYYPSTDDLYEEPMTRTSSELVNSDHNFQPSPPKTLSDLVAWSQKQACYQKEIESSKSIARSKNAEQAVKPLVEDYGSSSSED